MTEIVARIKEAEAQAAEIRRVTALKCNDKLIRYAAGKTAESFAVPEGVTTICAGAFKDCAALKNVTIPESVTTVEAGAFAGWTAEQSISVVFADASQTPAGWASGWSADAVINYTDAEVPYTRVIEHKHFAFGTQPHTVVSWEYSAEWRPGDEPYYPINDARNQALYARYAARMDADPNVYRCGRLAEYRYYDMDRAMENALALAARLLQDGKPNTL